MTLLNSIKREVWGWIKEVKDNREVIVFGLFLLIISLVIDYNSGKYVKNVAASPATDLILDHIPTIDLSFIHIYLWIAIMTLLFVYPLFFRVKKIHVVISQISLLILVRSLFIILTHLKAPVDAIVVKSYDIFTSITFENDLFFSGRVAFPFLGFFLFKDSKIRYLFLASSIILGITGLLMHQHYSIDVLAAYFITYGTYKFGTSLFAFMERAEKRRIR